MLLRGEKTPSQGACRAVEALAKGLNIWHGGNGWWFAEGWDLALLMLKINLAVGIVKNAKSSETFKIIYAFRTNSDFRPIAPKPSILQSMLWSPSVSLIFFTLEQAFTGLGMPLTGKSLMTMILSPFCSSFPFTSSTLMTSSAAVSGTSSGFHS